MKKKIVSLALVCFTMFSMGCVISELDYEEIDGKVLIEDIELYLNGGVEVELFVRYEGTVIINGNPMRLFTGYDPDFIGGLSLSVLDPMNFIGYPEGNKNVIGVVDMGIMNNETIFYVFITQGEIEAECMIVPTLTECSGNDDGDSIIIIPIDWAS